MVSGSTACAAPSRLGQSRIIHTSSARSLAAEDEEAHAGDAELMTKKQVLGFKPAPRLG